MKLNKHQRGMTGIGWIFVLALIVLILSIFIKIIPVYIDQFNVASVLASMEHEPNISTMPGREVTSTLIKRLDINMVSDVKSDDIYISQQSNVRLIEIEYHVQRKLLGNVDVLFHFNNQLEVPIR